VDTLAGTLEEQVTEAQMSHPADDQVLLPKLTRREFRQRMASGELRACIIPVAATEQHLEHLAMEHDWRSVLHIAMEVARRLHPRVLVAPAMNIGISEHHMRHPGTLSATPGAWLGVLHDAIRSMHHAGFKNILVLNGHGGNIAPCRGIWDQFQQRFEINLQFRSYWEFLPDDVARANVKTGRWPGHAQEFETAFALAAFPENVRSDAMADQADKEPLAATAEAGRVMIAAIVAGVGRHVAAMLDGTEVAPIPPFQP
jgi:creatinine amidohydrolase